MAQIINLDTEDTLDQVAKIILEGVLYIIRLRYNDRSGWQLSFYDPNIFNIDLADNSSAKLYGERKLMPNQDYFAHTNGVSTLPSGHLFLDDTEYINKASYKLPSRYDLGQGKRFQLIYFTKAELLELQQG